MFWKRWGPDHKVQWQHELGVHVKELNLKHLKLIRPHEPCPITKNVGGCDITKTSATQ